MRLSKIDPMALELFRVSSNPVGVIECSIDLIYRDKNMPVEIGKATQLDEEEIMTAIKLLFTGK